MSQKKNKLVVLLSSLLHDWAICSDSGKPEIIEFYKKTKGAVDMLDEMCARYTVQRANRRWTMAMSYGMINIAAVNALVIHAHNMRKDQPEKTLKRKEFLLRIAHDLLTPFVTQWYKIPILPRNIKIAIVMCGFVSETEETPCRALKTMRRYQESEDAVMYAAGIEMWGHNLSAKDVDITFTKTIRVWLLLVRLARIRMKLMNLISCLVFPTLLPLLQTTLSYLHSWIQKWILYITGIHIPYKVNGNHVIVKWGCHFSDVKPLFFCK